jgi:WD40 repeat protein
VRFWDPATEPDLLPSRVSGPSAPARTATSPDGRTTASIAGKNVDVSGPGGLFALSGHRDVVNAVAFSPDGSMLVTASRDHDARLWDSRSGQLLHVLQGHFGSVADARFSPDGRWVVTAGPISAGLWRVGDGRLFQYLHGPTDALTAVEFGPTGVFSTERNGAVRRFVCLLCGRTAELLAIADARLYATGRVLSQEERRRYG